MGAGARRRGKSGVDIDEDWATSNGRQFGPVPSQGLGLQCTTFTVLGERLKIMENLRDTLAWYDDVDDTNATLKLSKSAWKV